MKSLTALQQEFKDYVLHHDPRIVSEVMGTPKADAHTRLSIYANAYRLRLIEVLENHYEVLHTLLGDTEFDKLGHLYLDHYPSKHPNIRWFGRHLYRFLRENPPYNAHPALEEMATLEWALQYAFDAGDTTSLTIDAQHVGLHAATLIKGWVSEGMIAALKTS